MQYSDEYAIIQANLRVCIARSKLHALKMALSHIEDEAIEYAIESVTGITQDLYHIHEILSKSS